MVLHMLRKKLGDAVFFQGMKNYLSNPNLAFSYAKTTDFKASMEAASGQNLTEFFNDWIYNQGYPTYTVNWYQPQVDQIKITVNQIQSHASVNYFEAPIPIRIRGNGLEVIDLVLNNNFNGEEFLETINFQATSLEIDPDSHLISKFNSAVLGIEDVVYATELKIYPNPTSTSIRIDRPTDILIESVTVFNTLGQIESEFSTVEKIEVSHLTSGIYFLRIQTNQGTINKSFLKH